MSEHDNHGQSVAAWVTVGILIVAAAIMSLAVLFPNLWLFIGGVALGVVGLVAGKVLSMAGYGAANRDAELNPSIH